MRFGICIKGYWKDDFFDVELPDVWRHTSGEHISGFTEDYFDFDEDHIVDFLLERPYKCGVYLPNSIISKMLDKAKPTDEYIIETCEWLARYSPSLKEKIQNKKFSDCSKNQRVTE